MLLEISWIYFLDEISWFYFFGQVKGGKISIEQYVKEISNWSCTETSPSPVVIKMLHSVCNLMVVDFGKHFNKKVNERKLT